MRYIAAVALGLVAAAVALGSGGETQRGAAARGVPPLGPAAGQVRFVKIARPDFNHFTRGHRFTGWIRRHFWRMMTYSPYFDSRARAYREAWVYRDLYAIYPGSALARRHPEWILRDETGRPLYIPFECNGGSCPQYAGDLGSP